MKRLVYCFDGTWNDDSGETPLTNVVKLHRAVLPVDADGVQQTSRYIVGIATSFKGRTRFVMGAFGVEVGQRVLSAYRQLMADYQPGDRIHLFGFSRGAFEARALAGFIAMFGVGRADRGFPVAEAWRLYARHRANQVPALLNKLRAAAHHPVRIKCVGAWDTVGNIGNPLLPVGTATRRLEFHDAHLHEAIDVALHALSIDENRGPFSPTLWTLKKGAALAPGQSIEQVWFPGSHADVGGGYEETELSDIALMWMAERAMTKTGLAFDMQELESEAKPNPLGTLHPAATGRLYGWTKLLPFVRFIEQDTRPLSQLRRGTLGYWRTNKLPADEVSPNESLHDSVIVRFNRKAPEMTGSKVRDATYRPRNLAPILADEA